MAITYEVKVTRQALEQMQERLIRTVEENTILIQSDEHQSEMVGAFFMQKWRRLWEFYQVFLEKREKLNAKMNTDGVRFLMKRWSYYT